MTSLPLVRTEYLNPSTGTVRSGPTAHGESLVDMESYVMRHDQVGSSSLHTWGVAEGLTVTGTPSQSSVTVLPGVALDSAGHLIALAVGGFAIVDPNVDPTQVANIPTVPVTADGVGVATSGTGDHYLTITWREVLDPSSAGNAPLLIHAPWLRLLPVTDVSDTGQQVILARVNLDDQGQLTTLTADLRRPAGVPAGRVELRRTRNSPGSPLSVDQLASGEIRATDTGGLAVNLLSATGTSQQVLAADGSTGNLSLVPVAGAVGVGLGTTPPRRVVHVEGSEVHSGGPGGGFSFASRSVGSFVETPTAGERWLWYAQSGAARLWSGTDQLTVSRRTGGLGLAASSPGAQLELLANGGSLGKLALTADTVVARRADGSEPVVVDTRQGRIGQGTATPTHPLHVTGNTGIRQNSLYLGGGPGWSSLSYNAFHDDTNQNWVFPDPSRPAVTVEMDDSRGGPSRFQVFTTPNANKQAWQMRLGIDGDTGAVTIPGRLTVNTGISSAGAVSVSATASNTQALSVTNNAGTAICALNNSANGTTSQIVGGATGLFVWGSAQSASFANDVHVSGVLTANEKRFVIDHPLDPENRYLNHASVESAERVVVYSGNVECDADGRATVSLPDWLEALATDFRYQLTCVGGQSDVYIAEEVADNAFGIAGGAAGQRVSWQLTGVRHDAWAETHDLVVEEDKPEQERGFYQSPEAFGQDLTASVHWARREDLRTRHPLLTQHILRLHSEGEERRRATQTARRAADARAVDESASSETAKARERVPAAY